MNMLFTPLKNLTLIALLLMGTTAFAQPGNDHITDAYDLAWLIGGQGIDEAVAFTEATSTGDGGQQGCGTGVAGIYYKFTANAVGTVDAQIEPASDGIIVFYSAPNANAQTGEELTHVDQVTNPCDNGNVASIITEIGTTYYIFMKNNIDANVIINVSEAFVVPSNDQIENATELNGFEDYFDADQHMAMATFENDFGQTGCSSGEARAIWYKFTAQVEGQVVAGIGASPNANAIIFYEAPNENVTNGTELTWVDQPTNLCSENDLSSIITEAGKTYYIMAASLNAFADISVNLSGILGTQDQSLENFSFYPNPNSGILNIVAKGNLEQVSFYNVMGQKVLELPLEGTKVEVDLSSLANGFYLAQINSNGKVSTFKILKN